MPPSTSKFATQKARKQRLLIALSKARNQLNADIATRNKLVEKSAADKKAAEKKAAVATAQKRKQDEQLRVLKAMSKAKKQLNADIATRNKLVEQSAADKQAEEKAQRQ